MNVEPILIVTGGGRGIGAAVARLAARRGYLVYIDYQQNRKAAEEVVRAIEGDGGRAVAVQADISVESQVVRLFETVDLAGRPSALINNAATLESQMRLDAMDAARMHRTFATNVIGTMFMHARGCSPDVYTLWRIGRMRAFASMECAPVLFTRTCMRKVASRHASIA